MAEWLVAKVSSSSRSYKYLNEYYSTSSLDFLIINRGPGTAKVKVIEILNDEYTLGPGECVTHDVFLYAAVEFKSSNGVEVTVESYPGKCPEIYPINAEISSDTAIKNIEEPSDEVKALIKSFVEIQRDKLKERFFE